LLKLFWKKINCVASLVLVLLSISAITSFADEKKANNIVSSVRIAVIPFQAVLPENESASTVSCPLCGVGYFGGKVVKGAETVVEEIFIDKLKEFKEAEIIPLDKVMGVYKRVSVESLKMPLLDILKKVGAELGADVIVVGYVFRYVERIGYHYSAEKPASVAFEINFINAKNGDIFWRGVFDKTQKSLMEDLFQISSFLKGGGKWLTAQELTKQGMDQAFKKFPGFEH
jgi:hypothetical protein